MHTGLDEATLRAGGTLPELHARWRAFIRESDVVCSWGQWEPSLFVNDGGHLPAGQIDLRHITRDVTRGNVHSLREFPHGAEGSVLVGSVPVPGRAGRKLQALIDVVASFVAMTEPLKGA